MTWRNDMMTWRNDALPWRNDALLWRNDTLPWRSDVMAKRDENLFIFSTVSKLVPAAAAAEASTGRQRIKDNPMFLRKRK